MCCCGNRKIEKGYGVGGEKMLKKRGNSLGRGENL